MPHIIIETSKELSDIVRFEDNFLRLHDLFNQTDKSFDSKSCKSRVLIANSYLSGIDPDSNFVHVSVKIFPGRSAEVKTSLLNSLSKFFTEIIASSGVKTDFSIELSELNKDFYNKVKI
jgi:5-carboxymethyl-2-hydroxymuconate isomerase